MQNLQKLSQYKGLITKVCFYQCFKRDLHTIVMKVMPMQANAFKKGNLDMTNSQLNQKIYSPYSDTGQKFLSLTKNSSSRNKGQNLKESFYSYKYLPKDIQTIVLQRFKLLNVEQFLKERDGIIHVTNDHNTESFYNKCLLKNHSHKHLMPSLKLLKQYNNLESQGIKTFDLIKKIFNLSLDKQEDAFNTLNAEEKELVILYCYTSRRYSDFIAGAMKRTVVLDSVDSGYIVTFRIGFSEPDNTTFECLLKKDDLDNILKTLSEGEKVDITELVKKLNLKVSGKDLCEKPFTLIIRPINERTDIYASYVGEIQWEVNSQKISLPDRKDTIQVFVEEGLQNNQASFIQLKWGYEKTNDSYTLYPTHYKKDPEKSETKYSVTYVPAESQGSDTQSAEELFKRVGKKQIINKDLHKSLSSKIDMELLIQGYQQQINLI